MIVTNEGGKMMKKLVSFRFEEELVELAITEFIERKEKEVKLSE